MAIHPWNTEQVIGLLVKQIELVWSGVLRGDIDGRSRLLGEVMRSPARVGDLVLVGHVHPNVPAIDRLGWLERIEDALWQGEWDAGEPRPIERHWIIRRLVKPLDGPETINWTNVQILRVVEANRDDQPVPIHLLSECNATP